MSNGTSSKDRWDIARQTANVVGAVFQVSSGPIGTLIYGASVGEVSNANSTLVVPAGYAFAIWGLIFVLCLAYAVYQALPANRHNPLLRRVGWFSAGAFLLNGLWSLVFPAQLFLVAQVIILAIFACAGAAFLLVSRAGREHGLSRAERWLVVLPFGLLFGWITAATFVSIATTLVGVGVLRGGIGEAVLGAVLLLAGGLIAATVIRAAKSGPAQGTVAYSAAVLWALVAVVVNQYETSLLTTAAAAVAAVPVALALLDALRGNRTRRSSGSGARPRPV
ncbi:MAG TPA: hypothetical protein VK869_16150 [Rubrobacteraceae bacterium]|nr:hypothetical protein [Rubrobacteraceae bacterium]